VPLNPNQSVGQSINRPKCKYHASRRLFPDTLKTKKKTNKKTNIFSKQIVHQRTDWYSTLKYKIFCTNHAAFYSIIRKGEVIPSSAVRAKAGKGIQHLHNATGCISQRLFWVKDTACIQPIGHRLSLHPQTMTCDQNSHTQPWAAINGLDPHNPCNYMDYYSFADSREMEGWVGLVGWPIEDTLLTKWSHVNQRSRTDQGKSASQKLTS